MEAVIQDIQSCYSQASDDASLKQCVALDMAGKYADDLESKQTHLPNLDFFVTSLWAGRMSNYGNKAFGTQAQALDFMRNYDAAIYASSVRYM